MRLRTKLASESMSTVSTIIASPIRGGTAADGRAVRSEPYGHSRIWRPACEGRLGQISAHKVGTNKLDPVETGSRQVCPCQIGTVAIKVGQIVTTLCQRLLTFNRSQGHFRFEGRAVTALIVATYFLLLCGICGRNQAGKPYCSD
jgi:hypothetical protein